MLCFKTTSSGKGETWKVLILHRAGRSRGVGKGGARDVARPKTPGMGAVLGRAKGEAEKEVGRAALAPKIDTCWLKKPLRMN